MLHHCGAVLLLGLLALGLARHPNSKRSFGVWIITLFGIANTGITAGALLLPLLIVHQLSPRSNKTILLEMGITFILSLSIISILITPTVSIWLWGHSNLSGIQT